IHTGISERVSGPLSTRPYRREPSSSLSLLPRPGQTELCFTPHAEGRSLTVLIVQLICFGRGLFARGAVPDEKRGAWLPRLSRRLPPRTRRVSVPAQAARAEAKTWSQTVARGKLAVHHGEITAWLCTRRPWFPVRAFSTPQP